MTTNRPSIGRIVHYVSYGTPGGEYTSQCRAAIITEVPDFLNDPHPRPRNSRLRQVCSWLSRWGSARKHSQRQEANGTDGHWVAGLTVFNPSGMFFNQTIPYSDDHVGGTWHWPERAV